MGPRHLSRGIGFFEIVRQGQINRFNGATASEPWNHLQARKRTHRPGRFNGATASEPWNRRLS